MFFVSIFYYGAAGIVSIRGSCRFRVDFDFLLDSIFMKVPMKAHELAYELYSFGINVTFR